MKKIGIVIAMEKEWNAIFDNCNKGKDFVRGTTEYAVQYCAILSGIGKVNAAIAAYKLIKEYIVTDIISFGCAGGLTNEVNIGDVVMGNEYCYHDAWCGEPNQRGQVQGHPMFYPANDKEWAWLCPTAKHGLIATGDALCDNEIMAGAIVQTLGMNPIAVDMESAAIAQVCHQRNIPFTSIRVISDNPLLGDHASDYAGFWERKDITLAAIMRNFMLYRWTEDDWDKK